MLLCLAFIMMNGVSHAQKQENLWKSLAQISYKKEFDDFLGFKVDVPVFGKKVKALEGKEVTVRGYIIPVDGYRGQQEFVFSAFPYSMCFFCGGAGPETVMEVTAAKPITYTAEQITIKGTLLLNDSDVNRLMYAIKDAVLVKE